jgi:hypothetical protein
MDRVGIKPSRGIDYCRDTEIAARRLRRADESRFARGQNMSRARIGFRIYRRGLDPEHMRAADDPKRYLSPIRDE